MSKSPTSALALVKKFVGRENVISIHRPFIQLMDGDLTAAAMLDQLVFWSDKTDDPEGWFYKSATDWKSELGLSRRQVDRCKPLLAKVGVNTERRKVKGVPTTHYQVDMNKLSKALEGVHSIAPKRAIRMHQTVQSNAPNGAILLQTPTLQTQTTESEGTNVPLPSADADVRSAPSHPQSLDGQPDPCPPHEDYLHGEGKVYCRKCGRIADLHSEDSIPDPLQSSAKVSPAETAPTVKRAPLPHIGVIEAFLAPFLKDLPPDFKIGSCARVGMDLVKAGVTIDTMREAGLLYRAWYDATPGHQPSQLSWTVAGVTVAIRTALALAKAGIGGSQVHSFLAMRYTEAFWQDKTVSWKHVGEQIGRWLAKSSKVSEVPAIEMDENGMPIGYREMQEARRRADAIVAEKRRNGELR